MSARLVLVLLAALAIFASAQEEDAATCITSKKGNLSGDLVPVDVLISDGQPSIVYDLEGDRNPCGSPGNTNGLQVRVCVRAGTAVIRIGDRTAVVSRSSTTIPATIEFLFFCQQKVTPTNP